MQGWKDRLLNGEVIPALPLALNSDGSWSQRHQRGLVRYYAAAGAGGLAVGVHSTQFAIRDPKHGLYEPLLRLASQTIRQCVPDSEGFIAIAGICGGLQQAIGEASLARELGFQAGLLSLTALAQAPEEKLLEHCQQVSQVIPIVGFYLQPAVGGRVLSYEFWRKLADIQNLVAIKIAPFNRYFTGDVVRAVVDSGRQDVALYTGNDDNIIVDLLTPFEFSGQTRWIVGGLLGQWGVWTRRAVELLAEIRSIRGQDSVPTSWLQRNVQLTDANAAIFDASHGFSGCIPGIHEVLRRQGLLPSIRCLDENEVLSPGQADEITRISSAYPDLVDDLFVKEHLREWLEDT